MATNKYPDHISPLINVVNQAHASQDPHALRKATRNLVSSLEDQEDTIWKFVLQPCALAALISVFRMGLMTVWEGTKPLKDLAEQTKAAGAAQADTRLIARLMRALVLHDIFAEDEEEVYSHSARSRMLCTPPLRDQVQFMSEYQLSAMTELPNYLKHIEYRNPGDHESDPSLFQYTNKTDETFYQRLIKDPEKVAGFNAFQARSYDQERARIPGGFASVYPFEKELADVGPDEIAIVDVGGGHGYVVEDICKAVPAIRGKVVVEELKETLVGHAQLEGIRFVDHDFYEKQPILGARFYLFRHILHGYSDSTVRKIILNTIHNYKSSNKTPSPRLLIIDPLLPSLDPSTYGAMLDINMMGVGGRERKQSDWTALLESVGMQILRVFPPLGGARVGDTVIEAGLKQ